MEFLGDAVLNCLVTDHLYRLYPKKSEGQLSKVKSLIVSRKILGEIALSIGFGSISIIRQFRSEIRRQYGDCRFCPMRLRRCLERYILMAVLRKPREFLERFCYDRIDTFLSDVDNINYKSKILESSQRDGFGMPRYVTVAAIGPGSCQGI